MEREKRGYLMIIILVIVHLVGIAGLSIPATREIFQKISPVNIVFTAVVAFYFHPKWKPGFIISCVLIFLGGFFVEVAGVKSGILFGADYQYGPTLGPKILEVPIVMGVNWLMLIYSVSEFVRLLMQKGKTLSRAAAGATLMVMMDFVLEPVAYYLGFWKWEGGSVPILNYAMWYVLSFAFLYLILTYRTSKKNIVAAAVFPIQAGFFIFILLFGS